MIADDWMGSERDVFLHYLNKMRELVKLDGPLFELGLDLIQFGLFFFEGEGRVVARYLGDNPNGSYRDIAGITNDTGNVVGLMPHPEHAVEPLTGPTTDGLAFFTSLLLDRAGA